MFDLAFYAEYTSVWLQVQETAQMDSRTKRCLKHGKMGRTETCKNGNPVRRCNNLEILRRVILGETQCPEGASETHTQSTMLKS